MNARRKARRATGKPYGRESLYNLALWYVSRYATTQVRLRRYLLRKTAERGLDDAAGMPESIIDGILERLTRLGALDDAAYADMRVRSLAARGKGVRVMAGDLAAAGIAAQTAASAQGGISPIDVAVTFMQRRRLGAFGSADMSDPTERQRQLGRMARAGHALDLARDLLRLSDEAAVYDFVSLWKAERTD